MYTIAVDAPRGLVDITIEGFLGAEHLVSFPADLTAALRTATAGGRPSIVLCDYTRAVIQSQETMTMLQRFMAKPPIRSRKVALFTRGMLARRQAARLAQVRDDIRVFDDRATAMGWLAEA